MANWAKEIMILANDFCLDTTKVKQIVTEVNAILVPQDKCEEDWKYDRAYSRIKQMIMEV